MTDILCNLYRLNPRFAFSELHHMYSDDNIMYSSPSLSMEPSESVPYRSSNTDVEPAADFRNSQSVRKFSSEPSLGNTPRHSRCGFRERLQSDCLEDELPEFRRNASDNSTGCHVHTRKKLRHKHDTRHAQLQSHPKLRRPLYDCAARLNSSPASIATTEQVVPSLSEEEIRSICTDAFLKR